MVVAAGYVMVQVASVRSVATSLDAKASTAGLPPTPRARRPHGPRAPVTRPAAGDGSASLDLPSLLLVAFPA